MGIEPTSSAWKAEVLPLNYTRQLTRLRSTGAGNSGAQQPVHHALLQRWGPGSLVLHSLSVRVRGSWILPAPRWTGGGGRIRTFEGINQQIYSLPPLAAWVPLRGRKSAIVRFVRASVNKEAATETRLPGRHRAAAGAGSTRIAGSWCRKRDLNPQPTAYKAVALPVELFRQGHLVQDANPGCRPGF